MNRYQKAIRYTKPLVEIDEKIRHLDEMMTTTGFYTVVDQDAEVAEVPPTIGEIGDQFLGDFSDPSSLAQNVDYDNVSQLSSDDASGTSSPINSIMDTSNLGLADGVSALAMAAHGRAGQGVIYGYIDSNNVFTQVFVLGGTGASGYGTNDAIDDGLDWYYEYVDGKTVTEVPWKCYNLPDIYDSVMPPHATNVGPNGQYALHTNTLLHVKNQSFNNDDGVRHRPPRVTNVITRDDLGDVNFLPILMGIATPVLDALVDDFNDLPGRIIDLIPNYGKPFQTLLDYAEWSRNSSALASGQRTETRLDGGDKAGIIDKAGKLLETYYNPDGSPKNIPGQLSPETYIGNAIRGAITNTPEAYYIHGKLPTVDSKPEGDVLIHNRPTDEEGISPDGTGGWNINDGYDFTSASEYDLGIPLITPEQIQGVVAATIFQQTPDEVSLLPRQPIQTNLSADQLQGTLLGNVINHNLSQRRNVTESFNILENKSGIPDKYKLIKYISKEGLQKLQTRYPGSDPRLSELNWKMDIMMGASYTYVNKQFPENIERTSRVKKILAKNIKLSDPKTFKDVKQPMTYGKIYGNDFKDKKVKEKNFNKKSAGRFFKTEKKKNKSRTRWITG